MTQREGSVIDKLVVALLWLTIASDLHQIWRMAKFNRAMRRKLGVSKRDLGWLQEATQGEGRRLAEMVKRGEATREQLERAVRETGDGEPAYALKLLDDWGIR